MIAGMLARGAKFWLLVMNEFKNRGLNDVLIAVIDGFNGFPETINAIFPQARVQTCIVHLMRHSLNFVSYNGTEPDLTFQSFPDMPPLGRALGAHRFVDLDRHPLGHSSSLASTTASKASSGEVHVFDSSLGAPPLFVHATKRASGEPPLCWLSRLRSPSELGTS